MSLSPEFQERFQKIRDKAHQQIDELFDKVHELCNHEVSAQQTASQQLQQLQMISEITGPLNLSTTYRGPLDAAGQRQDLYSPFSDRSNENATPKNLSLPTYTHSEPISTAEGFATPMTPNATPDANNFSAPPAFLPNVPFASVPVSQPEPQFATVSIKQEFVSEQSEIAQPSAVFNAPTVCPGHDPNTVQQELQRAQFEAAQPSATSVVPETNPIIIKQELESAQILQIENPQIETPPVPQPNLELQQQFAENVNNPEVNLEPENAHQSGSSSASEEDCDCDHCISIKQEEQDDEVDGALEESVESFEVIDELHGNEADNASRDGIPMEVEHELDPGQPQVGDSSLQQQSSFLETTAPLNQGNLDDNLTPITSESSALKRVKEELIEEVEDDDDDVIFIPVKKQKVTQPEPAAEPEPELPPRQFSSPRALAPATTIETSENSAFERVIPQFDPTIESPASPDEEPPADNIVTIFNAQSTTTLTEPTDLETPPRASPKEPKDKKHKKSLTKPTEPRAKSRSPVKVVSKKSTSKHSTESTAKVPKKSRSSLKETSTTDTLSSAFKSSSGASSTSRHKADKPEKSLKSSKKVQKDTQPKHKPKLSITISPKATPSTSSAKSSKLLTKSSSVSKPESTSSKSKLPNEPKTPSSAPPKISTESRLFPDPKPSTASKTPLDPKIIITFPDPRIPAEPSPAKPPLTRSNSNDTENDIWYSHNDIKVIRMKCHENGCEQMFSMKKAHNEHMRDCHNRNPVICPLYGCISSFKNKQAYIHHSNHSHGNRSEWKCRICERIFHTDRSLFGHYFLCHEEGEFQCTRCAFSGKLRSLVISHFQHEHRKTKQPDKIRRQGSISGEPKGYNNKGSTEISEKYRIVCVRCQVAMCGLKFDTFADLDDHMEKDHDILPFRCILGDCTNSYKTKRELIDHIEIRHKEAPPFRCKHCRTESFVTYYELNYHDQQNHQLVQYGCMRNGCRFEAGTRANVDAHFNQWHLKKVLTISLECPESGCETVVSHEAVLAQHMEHKHGKLQNPCMHPECKQSFLTSAELNEHVKSHNVFSWKCPQCPVSRDGHQTLYKHVLYSHYTGQFKCAHKDCEFKATTRILIFNHYDKEHLELNEQPAESSQYQQQQPVVQTSRQTAQYQMEQMPYSAQSSDVPAQYNVDPSHFPGYHRNAMYRPQYSGY